MEIMGPVLRREAMWMAWAITSLPVPVSPLIRMVSVVLANLPIMSHKTDADFVFITRYLSNSYRRLSRRHSWKWLSRYGRNFHKCHIEKKIQYWFIAVLLP
jgi:hypothetical protein